jgi:hypothetical protein
MENPTHPPHRAAPPAELAVAALRYCTLPWADPSSASTPDADQLLATVRMTVQAYTDRWQSADRISAPMPEGGSQTTPGGLTKTPKSKPTLE